MFTLSSFIAVKRTSLLSLTNNCLITDAASLLEFFQWKFKFRHWIQAVDPHSEAAEQPGLDR